MTRYRIAIQAFTGSKPTEFANVSIKTKKGIKTIQKQIQKLFENEIRKNKK